MAVLRVGDTQKSVPDGKIKHRPVIVKFVSYMMRRLVFDKNKKLKWSSISVWEDLTSYRTQLLQSVKSVHWPRENLDFGWSN